MLWPQNVYLIQIICLFRWGRSEQRFGIPWNTLGLARWQGDGGTLRHLQQTLHLKNKK